MKKYLPFLLLFISGSLVFSSIKIYGDRQIASHYAQSFDVEYTDTLIYMIDHYKQGYSGYIYHRDERLCEFASYRLDQIQQEFKHFDKNDSRSFLSSTKYQMIGENLSQGFERPESVLRAWLDSKTHKENLDRDFTHSCIRCNNNKCVQIFAK